MVAIFTQLVGIKYKKRSRLVGRMYLNTSQKENAELKKKIRNDVNSEEPIEYLSTRGKQAVLCGVGKRA